MSIDRDEVKHIALLSRLELTEEEVETYTGHLAEILDYVEKLKSLDVGQVEPMSHAIPMFNTLSKDVVQPSISTDEALANAPDREGSHFRVPRVTE